jgi:hypothetical protein
MTEPKYKIRIPGSQSISDLTPEAAEDNIPLIASTPQEDIVSNEAKSTNLIKGNKLPASFESMKRNGFRFTSFESSINE